MKLQFLNKKNIIRLICLLILSEVAIQLFEAYYLQTNVSTLYSYIEVYPNYYTLKPNTLITQPERYGDIKYQTNAHGFRNSAQLESDDKILFLGDSVTFGLGVQESQIFTTLISKTLNTHSKKNSISCINLSMFGYTPRNELNVLKNIGLKFKPDQIILQLYMNDFYRRNTNNKPMNMIETITNNLIALKNMVINQSAFFRRFRQLGQKINFILFHDIRRKYFTDTLNDSEPQAISKLFMQYQLGEIESFQYIQEMNNIAKTNKIPYKIILTPNEVQLFTNKFDNINNKISLFCKQNEIPFFDMLQPFRLSRKKEYIFNDGLHLSPFGHKLVCEYLNQHVLKTTRVTDFGIKYF